MYQHSEPAQTFYFCDGEFAHECADGGTEWAIAYSVFVTCPRCGAYAPVDQVATDSWVDAGPSLPTGDDATTWPALIPVAVLALPVIWALARLIF